MIFRKATEKDLPKIAKIYANIHTAEESGAVTIGWNREVYPTIKTAEQALMRDDLFVGEDEGVIVGAAVINQQQMDSYKDGNWNYEASNDEVMVLHTLVIDTLTPRKGYGKSFVNFYEEYALSKNCHYLRIDTNEKNARARNMYRKLGYQEIGIVPCVFNGIKGVHMVLLEKKI